MPRRNAQKVEELKPTTQDVTWLMGNLDKVLHTHTTDLPHKGVDSTPIVERRTLVGKKESGPFVASTTIQGPAFRAAIDCGAQTVGAAMRLADDLGYATPGSFIDLALVPTNDLHERTRISSGTIEKLRNLLRATNDKAPESFSSDHAVVYFEAGDQEVLITPVMPVRVLRSINSRLVKGALRETNGRVWVAPPPIAMAMLVPQGGAQPQNIGHYVNAQPKPLPDGRIQNTGSRRGGYLALRVRAPTGQREGWVRDLARILATGQLGSICRVDRNQAQVYGARSRKKIVLPGLTVRLAVLRRAEVSQAQELVGDFLAPLFALRRSLQAQKRGNRRNLERLPLEDARWLNDEASREDLEAMAGRFADYLCRRVAELGGRNLGAESRDAIRKAMTRGLLQDHR
jgi:hypothetical protein